MDELYVFGYGYAAQFPQALRHQQPPQCLDVKTLPTPTCVLRAGSIEVAWASWCDLILKVDGTYHYTGTSLLPSQITAITAISDSPSSPAIFFGRPDTAGVLGFVLPSNSTLTTLHSPSEIADGAPPVSTTSYAAAPWTIRAIFFTAADIAFVHVAPRDTPSEAESSVVEFASLQHLQDFLRDPDTPAIKRTHVAVAHAAANTATLTVVSDRGAVYTHGTDRRFATAAGREMGPDPASELVTAQPVPFLEHTGIAKVVAGGLYTAALADDGELFVWGQAIAGTQGELRCLAEQDDDEDDYVRSVRVGDVAKVLDVAVGDGHMLVAVEERGLWAAGHNRYGALGLGADMEETEFVKDFTEVDALAGKRIRQMTCAGMSSYVVVDARYERGKMA